MRIISIKKQIMLLTGIIFFLASTLSAQNGVIKGRVYNSETNAPVPFANIIIEGTTTGSTSDLDGNYLITGLEPGFKKLKVSSIGYTTYFSEDVMVTNAKTSFVDIPMEPSAYSLENVVVTTSPFRKNEMSPVSMRTISLSEIEKSPGGNRDISRVIQSLPGVSSSASFRNDVIVRGGGASENRFYLDGMEIPNLNHFATQGASGGPAGIINTDFLREVEFYSGAFPVNRGNALSSVIDMYQISGNREKFVFRGSVGASDMSFTANGPLGENSTFIGSVRRSYLQFLFAGLGLPFLPTYNDYQIKYQTRFNDKNELNIISLGALDNFELNTGIKNPTDDQAYILGYLPVNEQWNYAIGAVYKHYGENHTDIVVLSRNMLNNTQLKYRDNDESLPENLLLNYLSQEIENKLRYERKIRMNSFKLLVGGGAEYAKYSNETYQQAVIFGEVKNIEYDSFLELYKWNFFAQASKSLLKDQLKLSLGIRMDANNYSDNMSNLLDQFSPRFSASYNINKKWSLNFNTGRFYQLPPYTTLGYRNNENILVNRENNLSYIRADHIVGGVEFLRTAKSKFTIEGFYKDYSNYMFSLRDSVSLASKGADFGTFGDEEVNSTSDGRAYGVEVLLREKDVAGFNLILSYTWVRSEFKDNDDDYIASAWDNRHLINFTVQRSFKGNWDAGFRWRLVGGSPYTPFDTELSSYKNVWNTNNRGYLDYSLYNAARLGTAHQLDIRVDKSFYYDKWSLMLYVDIQNVYNFKADSPPIFLLDTDENGVPKTDPNNPDKYILKEINTVNGTVLPTLGVIVEF